MRETTRTALLHAIAHLPTPDRLAALADWEERAAIMQWDGGMSYAEADERAAELVARKAGRELRPEVRL